MAAAIPEDVIINILCRLPVKTLLCFRCVSKQFRFIIDDPDFINRHLQFHRSLNRRRLIVEGPGRQANLFSIDLDSVGNAFKLELPFECYGSVLGSCDGLLAVSFNCHTSIWLWNISTRKHQILPKFGSDSDIYYDVFDGFGYDVATDDYKLVRVIEDSHYMIEVIVYSLKANSWRRIENRPRYHNCTVNEIAVLVGRPLNNGIGVLVGRALNWLVVLGINEYRVMSFDLTGEKFYEVPLPDIEDVAEADAELNIVVLDGCLCVSYFCSSETALDVWVMKEYGVKESWTKLFRLSEETLLTRGDFCFGTVAFASLKSFNKVLVYQANGKVFWHELDKKRDESIEINEWPTYITCAVIYMDSLVSPKALEADIFPVSVESNSAILRVLFILEWSLILKQVC